MKIAVISEISTADKNKDIISSLDNSVHEIINAGMKDPSEKHELTYIETGLMGALLLNSGRVDYVVGGCGTGQGFMNSIIQYPNVFCGLIRDPVDAWLFSAINAGNCISLALNRGYGWAGDINLKFIFEKLFNPDIGSGYPEHRKESQQKSRKVLKDITRKVHLSFPEIVKKMDAGVLARVLTYPGFWDILDADTIKAHDLCKVLKYRYAEVSAFR
jgi:ribose 5-phosphate isomerase RpiB